MKLLVSLLAAALCIASSADAYCHRSTEFDRESKFSDQDDQYMCYRGSVADLKRIDSNAKSIKIKYVPVYSFNENRQRDCVLGLC